MKEKDNPVSKLRRILLSEQFRLSHYDIIIGYKDYEYLRKYIPTKLRLFLLFDCKCNAKKKYGFQLKKR